MCYASPRNTPETQPEKHPVNVKVTFEFDTPEDAITAIARMRGVVSEAPKKEPAAATPKSAPKAEKVASEPPTAKAETAPAAPAAKAAPSPAPAPATDAYAPVSAAISAAVAAGHKPALIAFLSQFGVKTGKELKPEQYAEFMARVADFMARMAKVGETGDLD
jgi:hypothetical protein